MLLTIIWMLLLQLLVFLLVFFYDVFQVLVMVVPNLLGVLIFLPLVGTEAVVGIFYPNMTGDIIPVKSSSYGGTKFCSFGHNPLI